MTEEEFPATYQDKGTKMMHLDGVAWYDAPKPKRMHRCWVQTIGEMSDLIGITETIERCACGAIRIIGWADLAAGLRDDHPWLERNSR